MRPDCAGPWPVFGQFQLGPKVRLISSVSEAVSMRCPACGVFYEERSARCRNAAHSRMKVRRTLHRKLSSTNQLCWKKQPGWKKQRLLQVRNRDKQLPGIINL